MVNVAERTLNEVDVVLWLVEPTTFIGAGEKHIAEQLKKVSTPVILVINKIDSVKKEEILPAIAAYKDIYDFAEIVPVSARNGNNTEELLKMVMKYLPTVHSSMMKIRSLTSRSARSWQNLFGRKRCIPCRKRSLTGSPWR